MSDRRSLVSRAVVWCEILDWLQQQPDAKAAELLDRLMARYPNRYSRRQLRTLQRRVRQWRIVVAKQLVYAMLLPNRTK